jgi:hypothetical protein
MLSEKLLLYESNDVIGIAVSAEYLWAWAVLH